MGGAKPFADGKRLAAPIDWPSIRSRFRPPMLTRHKLFRLRNLLHAVLAIAACGATSAFAQAGMPPTAQRVHARSSRGRAASCQDCHGFAGTFLVTRVFPGATEATIRARHQQAAIAANSGGMSAVFDAMDAAENLRRCGSPCGRDPYRHRRRRLLRCRHRLQHRNRDVRQHGGWRHERTVRVLLTNSATNAATITLGNPAVNDGTGQVGNFRRATVAAGQTACMNGVVMQPGMSCSIGVEFVPTAAGARTATWRVNFVGNVPAREMTLQGTATGAGDCACTDLVGQRAIERRRRRAGLDQLARIAGAARRQPDAAPVIAASQQKRRIVGAFLYLRLNFALDGGK